jgi:hypothetical protein
VRPLNDETFKCAVIDLTKCTGDTNLQCNYVGDGGGDPQLAGLGLPPIALTAGESPGSEMLFKRRLHEVKALLESQAYLKNPSASEITAAQNQAVVLDGIARVLNGRPCNNGQSCEPSTSATASSSSSGNSGVTNPDEAASSPASIDDARKGEKKKTKSPAVAMAEASMLSQEAALLEAKNFEAMIQLQRDELLIRKEDSKQLRDERIEDRRLMVEERKQINVVLQKVVEKLCPDEDPTERYAERREN